MCLFGFAYLTPMDLGERESSLRRLTHRLMCLAVVFQRFDNTRSGFWRPVGFGACIAVLRWISQSDAASFLREIHDTNRTPLSCLADSTTCLLGLFVDDGAKYLARVMRRKKGKLEFGVSLHSRSTEHAALLLDDFLEACRRFPMLMYQVFAVQVSQPLRLGKVYIFQRRKNSETS